ncbi:MAG: hypothetical protein IPM37_19470 [Hahellaceae bacterium]|nr:hypothetical protein [Hahellaceae bacterium]
MKKRVYTSYPCEDYDHEGRVDLSLVRDDILLPEADYYLCGPIPFIRAHRDSLVSLGVPQSRIHYEIFGSHVLED